MAYRYLDHCGEPGKISSDCCDIIGLVKVLTLNCDKPIMGLVSDSE